MEAGIIIGSETEFGLVPRGKEKERENHRILNRLQHVLGAKMVKLFTIEQFLKSANWWKENLMKRETLSGDKDEMNEAMRRIGISGEYMPNGARMYVDGFHPEYSTPECLSPFEVVAYERAGERMMYKILQNVLKLEHLQADLLKRNCDYHSSSYACHENYCISRKLFNILAPDFNVENFSGFANLAQALWVFHLVTRQVYTGNGGFDQKQPWPNCFSLSQRQRFIRYFAHIDTTAYRSIINTRNRPYADPRQWARLHVICGDSNRADASNILKYGVSALVLMMLQDIVEGSFMLTSQNTERFRLANPIRSFQELISTQTKLFLESGASITVIEGQCILLELVSEWHRKKCESGLDISWIKEVLQLWNQVLSHLKNKDSAIYSLLDWGIKYSLLSERAGRGKKALQALDYHYHVVRPDSLYDYLLREGKITRFISKERIIRASQEPPQTRARIRMAIIKALHYAGKSEHCVTSWHYIENFGTEKLRKVRMEDPFGEIVSFLRDEKISFHLEGNSLMSEIRRILQ